MGMNSDTPGNAELDGTDFDVVIVGAGAGGAAAAWQLCRLGRKVLILEAGPRFTPSQDYSQTEADWERRRFPEKPGSQAQISYGDLGTLKAEDDGLASWSRVSGRLDSGTQRDRSGGYSHIQGVGGSTLHFVGESHRLHPRSMALHSDFGQGADWPLSYADLESYYQRCEELIGVAGPADQGARWRSAPYPYPAHPLSPAALRLQRAGRELGMVWQENSRAALSRPRGDRPACNYCASCSRGCPIGDKGSADVTFIREAEATGNLVIATGAAVVAVNLGPERLVESVDYIRDGRRRRQVTKVLILAAGAVQTPRLLLASASDAAPAGVANGSGQVGRNFMETLHWSSAGLLSGLRNSHMGLPADGICWDENAPDSVPGAVGGVRYHSNVQEIGLTGPIAYGSRLIDGFGPAFKAAMQAGFGSAVSVAAVGEVLPDARSFVSLDPEVRDQFGMRLPQINSVLSDNSLALLHHMAATCRRLLRQAGVSELAEELGSWDQFSATHVFGTCRMGSDPALAVVDAAGRSFEHRNLFIADGSIFPSSGGGESPSLTIQALALRMAERIFA
jgi:choline dehydrogenase-like flavoprotein